MSYNNYYQPESKWSKLTESEWKVILDDFQRKLFNLPKETEIIVLK